MTTLGELGEFDFIERVSRIFSKSSQSNNVEIVEGIGDDCAVVRIGDSTLLVSCDLSVEGVHFRFGKVGAADIGWKVVAAALSDIAAMGGVPVCALMSLGAPVDTDVDDLEAMAEGMHASAAACGAVIVGGDTTRSDTGLIIDVSVIGTAPDGNYLTRKGARVGDLLVATGAPGRSAAGLIAQERGIDAPELLHAHYHPEPRIAEGQWLCARDGVHAMIDVSDGVVQDAGHLAALADLGIEIDSAKVEPDSELAAFCDAHALSARELMLAGGEAYELLFALDPESGADTVVAFNEAFDVSASELGRFTDAFEGVRVDGEPPASKGFEHFATEDS